MKQAFQKLSTWALAVALIAPVSLFAQKEEKDKEVKEKKDVEQYIITRKGDKNEKTVIEISGDKITVNGKLVDENSKDGDVLVKKMKIKELSALSAFPRESWNMNNNFDMFLNSENSNQAMLGVTTEKADKGVLVQSVTKESGAEKAGLKEGDVITKIDDKTIDNPDDLSKTIRAHKPGDKVSVTYLRGNKEQKSTAELSKWKGSHSWTTIGDNFKMDLGDFNQRFQPAVPPTRTPFGQTWTYSGGSPKLGLSIQDTDDGKGVKVIEVDEESNAAKAGLKENDVITEVDGKAVNGADEMAKVIKESKTKASVMMKFSRGGKSQSVEVKIPRKLKTADL
jgi:serine protease Do